LGYTTAVDFRISNIQLATNDAPNSLHGGINKVLSSVDSVSGAAMAPPASSCGISEPKRIGRDIRLEQAMPTPGYERSG
jgi:hypothetical protein